MIIVKAARSEMETFKHIPISTLLVSHTHVLGIGVYVIIPKSFSW